MFSNIFIYFLYSVFRDIFLNNFFGGFLKRLAQHKPCHHRGVGPVSQYGSDKGDRSPDLLVVSQLGVGRLAENQKLKRIFKKRYSESTESFCFFFIDSVFCFEGFTAWHS